MTTRELDHNNLYHLITLGGRLRRGGRQSPLRDKEITKLLSHLNYIYGTDVLTTVNRANVNVSSDRYLWHDFVRRYNLYLDKETKIFIDFKKISC